MLPWGHAAVGYLAYRLYTFLRHRRPPVGAAVVALAVGTQFPDLVDKPLAWTFGVLTSGRSLAHSLLTATVVIALIAWYARRRDRSELAVAFAVGYLSHLFGDALGPLLDGEYVYFSSLGWPLLPPPPYTHEGGILAHFQGFTFTAMSVFEIALMVAVFGLWLRDGVPGLAVLRSWLGIGSDPSHGPNR